MTPQHYIDVTLKAGREGMPLPVVAAAVLKVMHGVFSSQPGIYALALPAYKEKKSPFSVLRVFAGQAKDLEWVAGIIASRHAFRPFVRVGCVREVPPVCEEHTEYRRFRFPKSRTNQYGYDKRLNEAKKQRIPYFSMQSKSNGHPFGLCVKPIAIEAGERQNIESSAVLISGFQPDSYGLSGASRRFALPDLPLSAVA